MRLVFGLPAFFLIGFGAVLFVFIATFGFMFLNYFLRFSQFVLASIIFLTSVFSEPSAPLLVSPRVPCVSAFTHDTQIYYSGVPLLRNGSYRDLVLKKGICCSKWRILNVLGGFQDKLKEMGGCCCCSFKGTELNTASAYYYYPRASEEHLPLSSGHGGASALSAGLLVDTNLDTSIPDTYRPPPAPMPYDVILGRPQTPPMAQEICNSKMDASVQTTNSESFQQTVDGNTLENSAKSEDPKESECKVKIDFDLDSAKGSEVELSKPVEPVIFASEEEDCPICLEEYDAENPKITTKCEHHFHLACILEWMERSDACPVCDKEMIFNPPIV